MSNHIPERLNTLLISGSGLNEIRSASVDMAACYSVLHHVPDYLTLVREMVRIVKPGGVIYIDHEASPEFWKGSEALVEYRAELSRSGNRAGRMKRMLDRPVAAWPYFIRNSVVGRWRRLRDSRHIAEGDLHIWPDDHIEWDRVIEAIAEASAETLYQEHYLGCVSQAYPSREYELFRHKCTTMSLLVARKL
jgi:SAM-dependent methyltransferase